MAASMNPSAFRANAEMLEKMRPVSLFSVQADRPATEFFDDDWEDTRSDSGSEFEDTETPVEESPRGSFDSFGRTSGTTVSTLEETPTPMIGDRGTFEVQIRRQHSVTGPKGPHLFRSSSDSVREYNYDNALQMSPLLPKHKQFQEPIEISSFSPSSSPFSAPETPRPFNQLGSAVAGLDVAEVETWSSQQVADWMYAAGFEEAVIQKFEEHDVSGAVLLDMEFEDLKELDIVSFGKRHKIWNDLSALRVDGSLSPAPTQFEDISSRGGNRTRSLSRRDRSCSRRRRDQSAGFECQTPITPGGGSKKKRTKRRPLEDIITPAESVSIVAIEQLLPKPHKCAKGENCPKYRKQQRMRDQVGMEFPISPRKGGEIFIAGNPGNAFSANNVVDNVFRPTSEAVPSVVASSDVLGAGQLPSLDPLEEDALKNLSKRDPQENVKQFLSFQHIQRSQSADLPKTPPLETPRFQMRHSTTSTITPEQAHQPLQPTQPKQPPIPVGNSKLKTLPKLSIPSAGSVEAAFPTARRPANATPISATPIAQLSANPLRRVGTPASEMDVQLFHKDIIVTPIARDISSSVPPNMRFRKPTKNRGSKDPSTWQRASFAMPSVPENTVAPSASAPTGSAGNDAKCIDVKIAASPVRPSARVLYGTGTTHAGYMKKRKNKLLHHTWEEHHFRLKGTQLAMHASARPEDRKALETIDVDDYTVACASVANNSKLAAAMKSLKIAVKREGKDVIGDDGTDAMFAFQLIPAAEKARVLKILREGKSHTFAARSREDRIDWMREVMLAKAMKQKGEGYEIIVNGEKV